MPAEHLQVRLHDDNTIPVEVHGQGPAVLLPVNPQPVEGPQAEEMRKWGVDPALGRTLIDGLGDAFRVVAFDYEGHVLQVPKPDTLTPANVVAVADAAGADRFAYYGYSWHAVNGLQLAIRTDRLTALVMGGYPPLDGPYEKMLRVTAATYDLAVANASATSTTEAAPASSPPSAEPAGPDEIDWSTVQVTLTEGQTRQFVTFYEALQDFDDRAALAQVTCPRLCFVGSADEITYDERWGGVRVSMAEPVISRRAELESLGWQVQILEGLDHTQAMQTSQVLPILRPWLLAAVGTTR
jgi:pimeloyl-ACP methyl ester carboxylesterase